MLNPTPKPIGATSWLHAETGKTMTLTTWPNGQTAGLFPAGTGIVFQTPRQAYELLEQHGWTCTDARDAAPRPASYGPRNAVNLRGARGVMYGLRREREARMTQTAFARAVGYSASAIARYEDGTRVPQLKDASTFARVLEVEVDELYRAEPARPPDAREEPGGWRHADRPMPAAHVLMERGVELKEVVAP
jgi:transcriptional regulator with XRE-family HTH domain